VSRELSAEGWSLLLAKFTPDGSQILVAGQQNNGPVQVLGFPVAGGRPAVLPVDPHGVVGLTKDGLHLLALDEQRRPVLRPLNGGEPRILGPPLDEKTLILGWDREKRLILRCPGGPTAARLDLLDLGTGKRTLWQVVGPTDTSGLVGVNDIILTPDLRTVAYSYSRAITSDLFLVDGLR
jgi:hypothetical protein